MSRNFGLRHRDDFDVAIQPGLAVPIVCAVLGFAILVCATVLSVI